MVREEPERREKPQLSREKSCGVRVAEEEGKREGLEKKIDTNKRKEKGKKERPKKKKDKRMI